MPKTLHIIAACAENRVIGRAGRLPWRIPEDATFFDVQTSGNTVIMGRICFEAWPRAPENNRKPIVVTRDTSLASNSVLVLPSFETALAKAESLPGEIYICGGQRIYEAALALAISPTRPIRLHVTLVHAEVEGDRLFPEWRDLVWRELTRRESGDSNYRYTFLELER